MLEHLQKLRSRFFKPSHFGALLLLLGMGLSFSVHADLPSGMGRKQPDAIDSSGGANLGGTISSGSATDTQVLSNGTSIVTSSNCSATNPLLCSHSTVITPPGVAQPPQQQSNTLSSVAPILGAGLQAVMGGGSKNKGGSSGSSSGKSGSGGSENSNGGGGSDGDSNSGSGSGSSASGNTSSGNSTTSDPRSSGGYSRENMEEPTDTSAQASSKGGVAAPQANPVTPAPSAPAATTTTEKPAAQSAPQAAPQVTEKPADKPADAPVQKQAEKAPEKKEEKTAEKPAENSSDATGSADADAIAEAATCGAGNGAGRNMCYRGVKAIIAAGLGLDLECTRKILSGGDAIDAMGQLPQLGFKNAGPSSPACQQPGTVLVYRGIASKMSSGAAQKLTRARFGANHMQGDISGHIEVVGKDRGYYSFLKAYEPMYKNRRNHMNERRILEGCFVASDTDKAHSACRSGKRCQLSRGSKSGNAQKRKR